MTTAVSPVPSPCSAAVSASVQCLCCSPPAGIYPGGAPVKQIRTVDKAAEEKVPSYALDFTSQFLETGRACDYSQDKVSDTREKPLGMTEQGKCPEASIQ